MDEPVTTADGKILISDALSWLIAKKQLEHAKANELEIRKRICEKILGDQRAGSVKHEDEQFKIKATAKENISVDEEILTALFQEGLLSEEECAPFSSKLHWSESKLSKLPKDSQVWKAVTKKPGTPGLEIERKDFDES